jgi:REP element-mobilizing transposase RayT
LDVPTSVQPAGRVLAAHCGTMSTTTRQRIAIPRLLPIFLTTCTYERRRTFVDHTIAEQTIARFRITCRQERFSLLAYCVMPDHMHVLLEGLDDASDFVAA